VQIATKYVEKLRVQRIVQLFDDFNSFDGMFSFLGAIIENGAGESLVTAVGGRAPMARTIEVFEEHHKIKGYSQTCLLWWSRFAKTSKIVAAAVCTISLRRPWLHPQSGKTVSSALKMAVLSGVYHRSGKECQSRIAGMALYLMSFTEKCFFFLQEWDVLHFVQRMGWGHLQCVRVQTTTQSKIRH
jgi:hypothetical protein